MTGNQFLYHEFKVMCDLVLQGFNKKEATQKLCNEIYTCMINRSINSNYEYIKYKKE